MGLVDYGSESEKEEEDGVPALPDRLMDMYQTGPRVANPEFHEGKIRTHEHVAGVWPSHVYLQWVPTADCARQIRQLVAMHPELTSLLESELGVSKPLHLSLSDTWMVSTHNKRQVLEQTIQAFNRKSVDLRLQPVEIAILNNQTKTRGFVAMVVDDIEIRRLVNNVDKVAKQFGLGQLGADHQPHVSIAWLDLQTTPQHKVQHILQDMSARGVNVSMQFHQAKLKIGRDVHTVEW